ncbi:SDR family oxidoreductase [Bacillus badius]|uniref:SDR family oxidoreductase n=1 Tax=Bacillus badius TaxID=1455 RepID=UPI000597338A|nr:SDR family NAD(P)-dependent oxidoreductase [Bacillus badius]KIL74695.1 3-oxoacyl-[acyl-carrier protein] reductase [Bacillus badius]
MEQLKLVIITGVTKGLGRSLVNRFDELGWRVAGCGRSKHLIEEMNLQFKGKHDFQPVDITNETEVEKWAKSVIALYGLPDLLINNASIINKNTSTWKIASKEFKDVMNINVMGVVNVIQAFVPEMVTKNKGMIINISSSWGRKGEAGLAAYCASKFAIEGLTQSMAMELPNNMAVVALDPGGSINTEMLNYGAQKYVAGSPSPEKWSKVAVQYLLSLTVQNNGQSLTCPCPN